MTIKTVFTFFILITNLSIAQDVIIGTQTWSVTNLDVYMFRNGDTILEAKTDVEWQMASKEGKPAWCYYKNKKKNISILYNWYAVHDARQLAPVGYHIPNDSEWTTLINFLGGEETAGYKLKNSTGWAIKFGRGSSFGNDDGNVTPLYGNGNDSSGFSALSMGCRNSSGFFDNFTSTGYWWSSSEENSEFAWYRSLYVTDDLVRRSMGRKGDGYSVRCIAD